MRVRTNRHENAETFTDETDYFVLGGGQLGVAVARQLDATGHAVTVVGTADVDDLPSLAGDPSTLDVLSDAGMSDRSTVVVASPSDSRNLLVAQLVRTRFDVDAVYVVVHTPDRFDIVAEAGHEPICATSVLADAVVTGVSSRLVEGDTA
jgi:Trk K+ transport system NAD-binding subunit